MIIRRIGRASLTLTMLALSTVAGITIAIHAPTASPVTPQTTSVELADHR